jgi:hypothetical protein
MGLVQESHPCWVVVCDRCHDGDGEDGGYFHHATQAQAEEHIRGLDWAQALDGSWLCLSCYEEAVTEQYACPHGAGCNADTCCQGNAPVPFTASHAGGRRPAVSEHAEGDAA